MYHFDIQLDGKAVNEQWHDTAIMFREAAELVLEQYRAVHAGIQKDVARGYGRRLCEAARLYELASKAYFNASAATIGHKKSERYQAQESECRNLSAQLYQEWRGTDVNFYGTIPDFAKLSSAIQ